MYIGTGDAYLVAIDTKTGKPDPAFGAGGKVATPVHLPGGAALLNQVTTDNANRTVAEIRNVFTRHGGHLAATNAVAWMFDRKGQIVVDA